MKIPYALTLLSTMSVTVAAAQPVHPEMDHFGVHSVLPDTRGNTLELTVANESTSSPAENIHMSITRRSAYLIFASTEQFIQSIAPGHAAVATWTFHVDRSAPVNKRDTLEFQITEKSGRVWTKSIIVQYSGPTTFALDQNFPNPFNPSTTIQYQLPVPSHVELVVFDILGREVTRLVSEDQLAGFHDISWVTNTVASGVYFYRINAIPVAGGASFQRILRMLLVK